METPPREGERMNEMETIEVTDHIEIPFIWKDPTPDSSNLGHAEFVVCITYKRGKIDSFVVSPAQQRNMKQCWKVSNVYNQVISISSYQGLEQANAWMFFWCKPHKASAFRLYVPSGSKYLRIDGNGLSFLKDSWESK